MIKSVTDLENVILNTSDGEIITIITSGFTHEMNMRLRQYIADGVLIPTQETLDHTYIDLRDLFRCGEWIFQTGKYVKTPKL